VAELISKHIEKARDKIDVEDVTDESVLAKLVRKHGKDSKVPVVMAIDAIGAGVETTGNTAIFLLSWQNIQKNKKRCIKKFTHS
jgi:hypothetical protein